VLLLLRVVSCDLVVNSSFLAVACPLDLELKAQIYTFKIKKL
jgi:hypothetical protein